jgi:hypothetical protein
MPIGDSDFNQDGASQAGELFTLGSQNITGIRVASTEVNRLLPDGNLLNRTGTFTRGDGSTGVSGETSANFFFAQDTFNRQFTDTIPLAAGVSALPDMQGSGKVRDLREAASQSPALLSALSQYSQATTRQAQRAQLDSTAPRRRRSRLPIGDRCWPFCDRHRFSCVPLLVQTWQGSR